MPHDPVTAAVMAVLIAVSAGGAAAAFGRLRLPRDARPSRGARLAAWGILIVAGGGLAYRMAGVHQTWAPLHSHADGVLVMVLLIGGIVAYVQAVGRPAGMDLFGLPVIAGLAGWGLCASWWTFDQSQFSVRGWWGAVHITAVYFGLASAAMTAICGGLYLFVQRQLKRRDDPAGRIRLLGRTASLEAIDRWLVGWATAAFVLLTLIGVVGGIDASTSRTSMGEAWWGQPKVWMAVVGWLIFAGLSHVRFAPAMRGRRAAILGVAGFAVVAAAAAMSLTSNGTRTGPATGPTDDESPGSDYIEASVEASQER